MVVHYFANMLQKARVSKNAKFRTQTRMFSTSGYVLIVCVLVKSGFLHTLRRDFSKKSWTFCSSGWHVLYDFRLNILRHYVLQNASLLQQNAMKLHLQSILVST